MKFDIKILLNYLRLLSSKWILWLFIALDVVAIGAQFAVTNFSLPNIAFFGIAAIGIIWAGFQVHLDLLGKLPEEARPLRPSVTFALQEGSEYSFAIHRFVDNLSEEDLMEIPEESREKLVKADVLPNSLVTLRMRLENTGQVPIEILASSGWSEYRSPFNFMIPEPKLESGERFSFPRPLAPGQTFQFHLVGSIHPGSSMTAAQIAARIRTIRQRNEFADTKLTVEVADPYGNLFNYAVSTRVAIRPLAEIYVDYWRELERDDLVGLAIPESLNDA